MQIKGLNIRHGRENLDGGLGWRLGRQRQHDGGAVPRCGNDIEPGADALGPFAHDAQADMGLVELVVAGEADAVVAHLEAPFGLLQYVDPDLRRARMLADIGQGLLDDVQYLDLQIGRQRQAVTLDRQMGLQAALDRKSVV